MIKRDRYLNQLINAKENGFPKAIAGVRRCGKSFLLKEIYREYLLSEDVPESRIIILELDDDKNSKYRDPLGLGAYIREKCKEKDIYYVFIDEIQKVYSIINPNFTDGKHVLADANDTEVKRPCSMCKNIEEDRENTYNLECWVLRKAYTGKSQFTDTRNTALAFMYEIERLEEIWDSYRLTRAITAKSWRSMSEISFPTRIFTKQSNC